MVTAGMGHGRQVRHGEEREDSQRLVADAGLVQALCKETLLNHFHSVCALGMGEGHGLAS